MIEVIKIGLPCCGGIIAVYLVIWLLKRALSGGRPVASDPQPARLRAIHYDATPQKNADYHNQAERWRACSQILRNQQQSIKPIEGPTQPWKVRG